MNLSCFYRPRYRYLYLISFLSVLFLNLNPVKPILAQYQPTTRSNSNPWQYAAFPVESFQAYTSPYGYRNNPVTGQSQFHYGLDIAAPQGSYIRNWWTGTIVELSDHTACGTMIRIQSGEWTHTYCHLMGYVEKKGHKTYLIDREGGIILNLGQVVPVNTRIARVGMTGRTTGPHLHWELKHRGKHIDPALVLQEMYGRETSL